MHRGNQTMFYALILFLATLLTAAAAFPTRSDWACLAGAARCNSPPGNARASSPSPNPWPGTRWSPGFVWQSVIHPEISITFAGSGYTSSSTTTGYLCDTWTFNVTALQAGSPAWRKATYTGVDDYNSNGVLSGPNAHPASRISAMGWTLDDKHYLFGGFRPPNTNYNDIWELNEITLTWTYYPIQGAWPGGRYYAVNFVIDGVIYLHGGTHGDASAPNAQLIYNDLWSLNVTSQLWYFHYMRMHLLVPCCRSLISGNASATNIAIFESTTAPRARAQHVSWTDNSIGYIFGGEDFQGVQYNDIWQFLPETRQWQFLSGCRNGAAQCCAGSATYLACSYGGSTPHLLPNFGPGLWFFGDYNLPLVSLKMKSDGEAVFTVHTLPAIPAEIAARVGFYLMAPHSLQNTILIFDGLRSDASMTYDDDLWRGTLCGIPGCVSCPNLTTCSTCDTSLGLLLEFDGTCVEECAEGEYPLNGVCQECSFGCANCSSSGLLYSSQCKSCDAPSGYLLNEEGSACIQGCAAAQFNASGRCQNCSKSCASCNSAEQCTSCAAGFVWTVTRDACVQSCPDGQFKNGSDSCDVCNKSCATCQVTPLNCTSCHTGFLLKNTACVVATNDTTSSTLTTSSTTIDSSTASSTTSNGVDETTTTTTTTTANTDPTTSASPTSDCATFEVAGNDGKCKINVGLVAGVAVAAAVVLIVLLASLACAIRRRRNRRSRGGNRKLDADQSASMRDATPTIEVVINLQPISPPLPADR